MTSNRNIFNIAYPVLLTLIAQNIINVVNTAFLGRIGEIELGASALGGVFYIAFYMLGFGFSQGTQILIGRRNGEQNYKQIGYIFNNALIFNSILSIAIFLLSFKAVPIIMQYAVHTKDVYNATKAYMDWRIYGYLFGFVNTIFRSFYVGITQTRVLTVSSIITAITNILFDYLLIFGHWGFLKLGIEGAGISSVIAEAVTMIYVLLYTLLKVDIQKYDLLKFNKIDWKEIGQILNLSVFLMFQYLISISTWFLFFIFIEHTGARPLAVSNIGRSLYVLLTIPSAALATTANTLVSNLIGANRKEEVLPFIKKMAAISFVVVAPFAIFAGLFPTIFTRIYTDNITLIADCLPVMRVIAFANLLFAISFIVFNGVSGTGNTRTAFLIEFVTLFFYIGYVYYTAIIAPQTTATIWMSEFVYWGIIGIMGYLYLSKGNWRSKEI